MKSSITNTLGCALVLSLSAQLARAEVKMPAIFGDHMVLQRNGAVPVWGWADAGEEILVTAGAAKVRATAGQDGKWQVKLPSMIVSARPLDLVVAGKTNTLTFHDVLVGDVWLCSGQSNMEFVTGRANTATEALPRANRPEIRFFLVANHAVPFKPQTDCKGAWEVCTSVTAKKFSAVGYFFAEQIATSQKTPVGMIGSYVPGTAAQSWISVEPLLADPALEKKYAPGYQRLSENFDALKAAHDQWQKEFGDDYKKALSAYYGLRNKARREGQPEPTPPPKPATPEPFFPKPPSFFFNGMIAPIIPYALKGGLWYQGESNAGDDLYRKLFPALIADWRSRWGQGDFPFLLVQLPNYKPRTNEPSEKENGRDSGTVVIREAQLETLKTVANTGMAVTIDLGEAENIHPPDKIDVADRLVRCAQHIAYGEDIVFSGPIYDSCTIGGEKVHIKFKHAGTGLKIGTPPPAALKQTAAAIPGTDASVANPSASPVTISTELHGFAIAGADKKFVWAKAAIESPDTITVWSDEVKQPVAVRYGWAENPEVNLYNSADLPASPFRTDTPVTH
jgi:sialate O-acetylesterase